MVAAAIVGCVLLIRSVRPRKPLSLTGVVLTDDSDPRKQTPIGNAEITATAHAGRTAAVSSDVSGLFHLPLPVASRRETWAVSVRHPGYQPIELTVTDSSQLLVVRMLSSAAPTALQKSTETVIANARIRYSGKANTTTNIGSVAETFEVANAGNVACGGVPPCSPDNRWKATVGSYSVDAGQGNELRSIRLSCIAGPCPFTHIEKEDLSQNGRTLNVSVLDWSATATFLLEAEVSQTRINDVVRQSYPAIFGSTMSFTLPSGSEGPSIEAELNGNDIVFPLGPDLILSWATCSVKPSTEQGNLYRCELKAGYRFK